jgi:hypothetical protein
MFHWNYEERVPTTASHDTIWALWSSPETWPKWDVEIDWVRFTGPFVAGAKGTMRPAGGPIVPFVLTHVDEGKSFADCSKLPLTKLRFSHHIEEGAIVHRVQMHGLLTPLFRRVIGTKIEHGMRGAMTALVNLAESKDSDAPR